MDRWDGVGLTGVVLVTVGIQRLAGDAWAVIFIGVLLMALYTVRELSRARGEVKK